jgi:hypothetical protein
MSSSTTKAPNTADDMSNSKEAAIRNAAVGLEELKLLQGGVFDKIATLERDIMYRRFYFPGSVPKKIIAGVGTDTLTVRYDNIDGERDIFTKWDPRYLDDYIFQCRQKGFHKHILYYDGNNICHADFLFIYNNIRSQVDFSMRTIIHANDTSTVKLIFGLFAGLDYADKWSSFLSEYGTAIGYSKNNYETMIERDTSTYPMAMRMLQSFVGQTMADYIRFDWGMLMEDNHRELWFADDLMQAWEDIQGEYREYKERIWKILENTSILNLCSNYVNNVSIGNVTIDQQMSCSVKVENMIQNADEAALANMIPEGSHEEVSVDSVAKSKNGTTTTHADTIPDEEKDDIIDEVNNNGASPVPSVPVVPVDDNSSTILGMSPASFVVVVTIVIIILGCSAGVIIFLIIKNKKQKAQAVNLVPSATHV